LGKKVIASVRFLAPVFSAVGGVLTRFFVLPLYKTFVMVRLRVARILLSARGIFFLLVTNRYVFHGLLLLITGVTVVTQWQAKNATAMEVGQKSLLYVLVTDGKAESVEESVRPELLVKDADYLGPGTIVAVPNIDYDYEPDVDQPDANSIPGSLAVGPIGEPSTQADRQIKRTKTETYTVQDGDTVASIAREYGVNVGTIVWTNKLDTRASIKPGDTLKIPPTSGVLHVVKKGETISKLASLYDIDAEQILAANNLTSASAIAVGEEVVIPGAVPPPVPVAVKPSALNSTLKRPTTPIAIRTDIPKLSAIPNKSVDKYQEIVTTKKDDRPKPPDADTAATSKVKLLWPTTQHSITQYYGWKHTGVDLDGDYTDAIYAAEDGTVVEAGWNSGGYGLQVVIDHGNGFKTRYGHSSKLFVKVGDKVTRGETIAMVGTTGRSTGTHLHFEVYLNGKRTNPLAYIR
jgi:murein DD-endopeptidase MepM/ murein hydrolase activator NlpD